MTSGNFIAVSCLSSQVTQLRPASQVIIDPRFSFFFTTNFISKIVIQVKTTVKKILFHYN